LEGLSEPSLNIFWDEPKMAGVSGPHEGLMEEYSEFSFEITG
jgi:hypothetical protein